MRCPEKLIYVCYSLGNLNIIASKDNGNGQEYFMSKMHQKLICSIDFFLLQNENRVMSH